MKRYTLELDDATAAQLEQLSAGQPEMLIREAVLDWLLGNEKHRLQEGYQRRRGEDRSIGRDFSKLDRSFWRS